MTVEEHYKVIAPRLTNWLVATGSSYANACDLVQETFLRLWRMREDLQDNDAAVAGLAFATAKNLRKNFYRDNARVDFVEEVSENASKAPTPPTDKHDVAYIRSCLVSAFAELPPLLREAYTLFQIGELSIREIAHETGASEELVKVRIFRAKTKLKEILSRNSELAAFIDK